MFLFHLPDGVVTILCFHTYHKILLVSEHMPQLSITENEVAITLHFQLV